MSSGARPPDSSQVLAFCLILWDLITQPPVHALLPMPNRCFLLPDAQSQSGAWFLPHQLRLEARLAGLRPLRPRLLEEFIRPWPEPRTPTPGLVKIFAKNAVMPTVPRMRLAIGAPRQPYHMDVRYTCISATSACCLRVCTLDGACAHTSPVVSNVAEQAAFTPTWTPGKGKVCRNGKCRGNNACTWCRPT